MAKVCFRALVSGKVQGVFYRGSTRQQAHTLNVSGYAKNLASGEVEVLACGEEEQVKALIEWLHTGPSGCRVDQVVAEQHEWTNFQGFDVL